MLQKAVVVLFTVLEIVVLSTRSLLKVKNLSNNFFAKAGLMYAQS